MSAAKVQSAATPPGGRDRKVALAGSFHWDVHRYIRDTVIFSPGLGGSARRHREQCSRRRELHGRKEMVIDGPVPLLFVGVNPGAEIRRGADTRVTGASYS